MSNLAIDGGTPIRTKPWIDNFTTGDEEIQALIDVMKGGYLSKFEGSFTPDPPFRFDGGPWVRKLEDLMCERIGASHAISVNSATSGLYAAVGALGLGFGDEMITSPYTMTACAMAAIVFGAIPVFADVEMETGSLSVASIRANITPRTKAIMIVHQFGIPADMDGIMALAKEFDLRVIEDCAQAWGAHYKGQPVGTIGDIGVYSFNVNKTVQSGEGGACLTNDPDLAYRMQLIRNHGEAVVGPAGYENITNICGQNYRLTELSAAVAYEQLRKLETLNDKRLSLVNRLSEGLSTYDCFIVPPGRSDSLSTYYVYPLRYVAERFGNRERNQIIRAVNAEGINFFQGYTRPLYMQPLYQRRTAFKHGYPWSAPENRDSNPNYAQGACPNCEMLHYHQMIINEHIRPPQTAEDITDILKAVDKVMAALDHGTE